MDHYEFWDRFHYSTWITYIVGAFFLFGFLCVYHDHLDLYEFQHDLFAAVKGEDTKYERIDAQNIADVLKKIPAEELDEHFSYITMISSGVDSKARAAMRDAIAITHAQKAEQIVLYHGMVENWSGDNGCDFRDTIVNTKMRMALKEALKNGGATPVFELPGLFFPSYSFGWNMLILIAIIQSTAFGIYCLACGLCRNYPLNFPNREIGPRVAMIVTFPGNLPLMVLMIIIGAGILVFSRCRSYAPLPSKDPLGASAKRSRQMLDNIKNRLRE